MRKFVKVQFNASLDNVTLARSIATCFLLDKNLNVPKSECYLPNVVSELIEKGEKNVKLLVAEDKWYGVTYKEDKETVVNAIADMFKSGMYDGI